MLFKGQGDVKAADGPTAQTGRKGGESIFRWGEGDIDPVHTARLEPVVMN